MNAPNVHALRRQDGMTDSEESARFRAPPHSLEAEQSVLGCLLQDNATAWPAVKDLLTPASFFRHEHRTIYGAMSDMLRAGELVDVITLHERLLQVMPPSQDIGGMAYLYAIEQSVPSARSAKRYAELVRDRADQRALIAHLEDACTIAWRAEPDVHERVAELLDRAKAVRKSVAKVTLPLLDLQALQEASAAQRWLVKRAIPADSIGMIFGGSGTFKSFIALDLALHVAHGLPWLGRKTEQGPVLFIAAEGGSGVWRRVEAWHRWRGRKSAGCPLYVLPQAVDLKADAWRVVESAQARGITPALVVVDTLSQTYVGEENSANEMAAYLGALGAKFRALWGCAVVLIHHTGHTATERPRGSSAIRTNVDFLFGVSRDEQQMLATLECQKQKDEELLPEESFALSVVELGTDADGDQVKALAAHRISDTAQVLEIMASESKRGRGGRNQVLVGLIQNGMEERELRKAFYDELADENAEAKKKAFFRAMSWAKNANLIEVAQGRILLISRRSGTT